MVAFAHVHAVVLRPFPPPPRVITGILEYTTLKSIHYYLQCKISIHTVFRLNRMVFIIELFYMLLPIYIYFYAVDMLYVWSLVSI